MTLTEIQKDFVSEDKCNECKARLDHENVLGWLKTVDGFANREGGNLYLGVEDKTYKLIGYDQEEIDNEKMFFGKTLREHFPIMPEYSFLPLPYSLRGQTRYILRIKIVEAREKPLMLKYQEMPMAFLRRDGFTNAMTMEEFFSLAKRSGPLSFDVQPTDEIFDIDDFKSLNEFRLKHAGAGIKEKELASIGFFDGGKKLKKGATLFKDGCKDPCLKVVCSMYAGNTRGDDLILGSNAFVGNIADAFAFAFDFVEMRMNHGFIKKSTGRVDIDAYPSRALFEGLINAFAHRDYLISGSEIAIGLYKNRLQITSPGSIFGSDEMPITYDFASLASNRRNELISAIFVYCKAMEAKGTGFEKIIDDYAGQDIYHRPYIFAKNNLFTLVLPDLTCSDGVEPSTSLLTLSNGGNDIKFASTIALFCYAKKRLSREIAEKIGISDSSYFRKSILSPLVDKGYLNVYKNGPVSYYLTNRELVREN